jgi:RNA polymerase-binding transcription factor DksA
LTFWDATERENDGGFPHKTRRLALTTDRVNFHTSCEKSLGSRNATIADIQNIQVTAGTTFALIIYGFSTSGGGNVMKKYKTLRRQLETRLTEIQQRLEKISLDRRHANQPLNADFEEQAIELENDQVLDALDVQIRAEIKQIERTLALMDEGVYGRCEECGEPIGEKRLEALPHASRCIACEEQFQQGQIRI